MSVVPSRLNLLLAPAAARQCPMMQSGPAHVTSKTTPSARNGKCNVPPQPEWQPHEFGFFALVPAKASPYAAYIVPPSEPPCLRKEVPRSRRRPNAATSARWKTTRKTGTWRQAGCLSKSPAKSGRRGVLHRVPSRKGWSAFRDTRQDSSVSSRSSWHLLCHPSPRPWTQVPRCWDLVRPFEN